MAAAKLSMMDGLQESLSQGDSERPIARWLKEHPLAISHAVGGFAFPSHVVAEFPFGNDYRADFVALGPFSGGFSVNFIELEPPDAQLFTKKGVPARRLNEAITQVSDWKVFVEKHRSTLLHDLSKFFKDRELHWERGEEPMDNTGQPLYHQKAWLHLNYHIVIGRRASLNERDMEKKASMFSTHEINVMTYDRIVEAARKLTD